MPSVLTPGRAREWYDRAATFENPTGLASAGAGATATTNVLSVATARRSVLEVVHLRAGLIGAPAAGDIALARVEIAQDGANFDDVFTVRALDTAPNNEEFGTQDLFVVLQGGAVVRVLADATQSTVGVEAELALQALTYFPLG